MIEDRLRELLRDVADETPPQTHVPPGLVGRAHRRIAVVATTAVLVVVAMVVGSLVAVRTLASAPPTVPATHPPSPRPSVISSHPTTTPPPSSPAGVAGCSGAASALAVDSTQGAAGTMRTVWRIRNTGTASCQVNGYPATDFHASGRWLGVQVHHGGFGDINERPTHIVVQPGASMYFVSYWSDVTGTGPCSQFDRVRVTLPNDRTAIETAATGCINPSSVDVGPLVKARPA
jgi:Protein of unknown function (DUF4232)